MLETAESKRFSFGWLFTLRAWLGLAVAVLLPLSITVAGLVERVTGAIAVGLLLQAAFGILAVNLVTILTRLARVAVVSSIGVETWSFLGKHRSLKWTETEELTEFEVFIFGQAIPQLRLRGRGGNVRLGFDGRMPGFETLSAIARANASGMRRRANGRRWWQRAFLPS